jgi:hypothetical protein
MPSHGYYQYYTGSNHHSRRRSTRRSSDAGRLYNTEDSAKILDASREALKQAQRRHARRHSGGYYYTIPRTDTPEIPSYEEFLAEARARVNRADSSRLDPAYNHQEQFRPNPYLYGYPSGYYTELRAPLHYTDSARTGKSARSSTLVGSETTYSPTLVDSGRTSLERAHTVRTAHPRRQTRVSWGPTYTCVEPPPVSTANSLTDKHLIPLPLFASATATASQAEVLAREVITEGPSPFTRQAQRHKQGGKQEEESESSSVTEDGLLPYTPPPVNLSPSLFIKHKTYINTDSAIRERQKHREHASRARLDELVRNELLGSAGVGNGTLMSRWSPDSSPDLTSPLRLLFRHFSISHRSRSSRGRRRQSVHPSA